jgi:hypothetical protein
VRREAGCAESSRRRWHPAGAGGNHPLPRSLAVLPHQPAGGARAPARLVTRVRSPVGRGKGRARASERGDSHAAGRTDRRASRAMAGHAARRCCLGWDFSTQQVPSWAPGRAAGALALGRPAAAAPPPGVWPRGASCVPDPGPSRNAGAPRRDPAGAAEASRSGSRAVLGLGGRARRP